MHRRSSSPPSLIVISSLDSSTYSMLLGPWWPELWTDRNIWVLAVGGVDDLKHTKLRLSLPSLLLGKGDMRCSTISKKDLGYYSSFDDVMMRLMEKAKNKITLNFVWPTSFVIIINREGDVKTRFTPIIAPWQHAMRWRKWLVHTAGQNVSIDLIYTRNLPMFFLMHNLLLSC